MLSPQGSLSDDSSLEISPQNTNQALKEDPARMDCEGFQNLEEWCLTPGDLQTPTFTDVRYGYSLPENTMSSTVDVASKGTEEYWEDWALKVEMEDDSTVYQQASPFPIQCYTEHNYSNVGNDPKTMSNRIGNIDNNIIYETITIDDSLPPFEDNIHYPNMASPADSLKNDVFFSSYNTEQKNYLRNFSQPPPMNIIQKIQPHSATAENSINIKRSDINIDSTNKSFPYCVIGLPLSNEKLNNDMVISSIIIADKSDSSLPVDSICKDTLRKPLKLDFTKTLPNPSVFNPDINTPDILLAIEQLENEKEFQSISFSTDNTTSDVYTSYQSPASSVIENSRVEELSPAEILTPPDTPRLPPRKRRRDSESSDMSYIPPTEKRQRTSTPKSKKDSYKSAYELNILQKLTSPVRRGRPPNRRDSISSCGTNVDDGASIEDKYRERRDKNNEASRRSRYNRKQKDKDLVEHADNMEEKNELLKREAEKIERNIKKLKDAIFKAMLKK